MQGRAKLVVIAGPHEGTEYPLFAGPVIIGRNTQSATWDICLQDRSVSRPHARLECDAATGVWRIADLGSANGTLLNDELVTDPTGQALQDGDVVCIGETELLFSTVENG